MEAKKTVREIRAAKREEHFVVINKHRNWIGMGAIVKKKRDCLKCGKRFLSAGPGHRICCTNNHVRNYGVE